MPKKQSQLAKLTRPRLHKAVARQRLFGILDGAHEHNPVVCVVGPPGAGKTTLVASWLDARGIKGIWYQVDAGDADLATFFYYLGQAALPFRRKGQRALPALTPEYLQDVEGFSRRFFRELFTRLPEGATLVLDNYQEVEASQRFHEIVAQAATEIAPPQSLIAVSRRDPPDCYARLVANENVQLVDWEDLRFTADEVREVIQSRGGGTTAMEAQRWQEISGGWAAGLTLMLEDGRRDGAGHAGLPTGREAVFRYFAGSLFDKAPEDVQRFLMATACMSQVPVSVARVLTGRDDAGEILEDLYRRHLFTHRRPAREETYWYHALFREFLQSQGRKRLPPEDEHALKLHAAKLLHAQGFHEDSFQLLCDVHEWPDATAVLLQQAADLVAQGRLQTLRDWLGRLPEKMFHEQPQLNYWLGRATMPIDLKRARFCLERAFEQFEAAGNTAWQLYSAAGVVDTWYYAWTQFQPMTRWARIMGELTQKNPGFDSIRAELHVYSSWLVSMLFGDPGNPKLERCVDRVTGMLDEDLDSNSKVAAGAFLMVYCVLASRLDRGEFLMQRIPRLLAGKEITPLSRAWWKVREGYYLLLRGRYEEGNEALREAEAVCTEHGLGGITSVAGLIASYQVLGGAYIGDTAEVLRQVRKMERLAVGERPSDAWLVTCGRLHLACATRHYEAMRDMAPAAIEAAQGTGMPYVQILSRMTTATAYCELGMWPELERLLDETRSSIEGTCFSYFESEIRILEAWAEYARSGDARLIEPALRHARINGYAYVKMFRYSPIVSRIFAAALRHGFEAEYVKNQIRTLRTESPDPYIENWPWPVRVFTLGRFEIRIDGSKLEFTGKSPRKSLALLKAVIAGGGVRVPEDRITDALWPDEEADLARKSLDVTILRLRKMLGYQAALLVADDTVSLNPKICWVDALAFDALTRALDASGTCSGAEFESACGLYRGTFLEQDTAEPWALKTRERLKTRFIQLVESGAGSEERLGHWEQALLLYARGLEADELVEPFYQGIMRCHRELSRHAEAMRVFRRMRHLLSVVLGISPSESSQALARELQQERPAQFDSR